MKSLGVSCFLVFCLICCVLPAKGQECTPTRREWFGSRNQYKCHCTNNGCNTAGACCGRDKCESGWFGPACQYADLVKSSRFGATILLDGQSSGNFWLTDSNDATCNTDSTSHNLTVTFNTALPFTWLRLAVNNSTILKDFVLKFRDSSGSTVDCHRLRNATVTRKILDVHCEVNETIQAVMLMGKGVPSLCSLHISGGRNVALKQVTNQTSTYESTRYSVTRNKSRSENAVDGNSSGDFNDHSCTHTENELNSTWILTLFSEMVVNRYRIYNRVDGNNQGRLGGFQIESLNSRSQITFNKTDPFNNPQNVYDIISNNLDSDVRYVKIFRNDDVSAILTLCEVEAYGDSICNGSTYGRECELSCRCQNNSEKCFTSTGGCPSGCRAGYFGEGCMTECGSGYFGVDCQQICSQDCVNQLCHHVTGRCINCSQGKTGDICQEECQSGTYGDRCINKCSPECKDDVACDIKSGACPNGCEPGYTEPLCVEECKPQTYGLGCSQNCSSLNCKVNTTQEPKVCHHASGECLLGCESGYEGLTCSKVISKGTNVGAIVGPIILLILVVIAVFVVVFVWRRRKRTKGNNLLDHGSQADVTESAFSNPGQTKTGRSGSVPGDKKISKDNNGFEPPPTGDTDDVAYFNVGPGAPAPGTSIAVDELSSYMASHAKDFFVSQFSKIPTSCNAPTSIGLSAENKHKNRYKNICAYDHSRVLLNKDPDKKHGDYINASYVHGYKDEEKYIASQGPNKVILEDFVRMLWEQKVDKVVMLTKLVEEGRHKCEQYWPEDGEVEFDEIKVRLAATQVFADYTIRRLQLIKVGGHPIHSITHFHFTSWPDKGVPPSPWALVDFEQRVASYPSTQPIVVHCSAGVGRTGTFIALRKVMREAEDTGHMDFYNTLWSLRQDRVYMIQTAEQYMFLHEAAQVAMVCMGTTITSEDISDRMKTLHSTLPSGQTKLEQEFKAVCNVCAGSEENQDDEGSGGSIASMYQNSRSVNNRLKNRFSNILPKESYRPFLSLESKDNGDYINAVLLPDFAKQNKQILTQLPLTTTVLDLWRLVLQYKVNLIVAFDLESNDSTIGSYLPSSETEPLHCGPFDIESQPPTSDSDDSLWVAQKLSVIYHKKKKMRMSTSSTHTEEHFLTHIKCTASKLDPEKLLNFVTQAKACKPETEGRTVYMCRNGATYSGLACVLSLLLDRLDNDHQLTVPLVVGAIKTVRPQVIPTLEQYSSLYQALQIYIDNASVYTNFAGAEPPANLPIMEVNNQAFEQDQSDDVNVYANS